MNNDPQPTGSVSLLIANFKDGDLAALAKLHERYWPQLVNIARRRLNRAPIRHVDEEDVAQSALIGFYNTVLDQRVQQLENREQLLALLSHIVTCKAVNQIQKAMAQKRGAGKVRELSPVAYLATAPESDVVDQAILKDCYESVMSKLPEELRPFAEMHLAGYSNNEIAEKQDCVERTVERKLSLLRSKCRQLADDQL